VVSKAIIPFSFDQLLEAYANAIKNGFGPEAIYFAALDRRVSDQNLTPPKRGETAHEWGTQDGVVDGPASSFNCSSQVPY
jgi:hypothetical protein